MSGRERGGTKRHITCEACAHNLLAVQFVTGELEEQRWFIML
jgi:hypothetical protein